MIELRYFAGCVACIAVSLKHFVSCDFDGEVKLWGKSGELLDSLDMESVLIGNDLHCISTDIKSRSLTISSDSSTVGVALQGVHLLVLLAVRNGSHFSNIRFLQFVLLRS